MNEIYRWLDIKELEALLNKKSIKAKKKYISLTLDPKSAASAGFSGCLVSFNYSELNKLNDLNEIWYEPEYFELYPDVAKYVLGYIEEDYDEDSMGMSWIDYIESFETEQEVVVKNKLKINNKCINSIKVPKKYKDKIEKFKNEYKIILERIIMKKSELRKIIKEEINRLNEDQKYSDEMEEFMDVLFADDIAPEQEPEVKGRTLILKYKNKKDYNKVKNMTVWGFNLKVELIK